MRKLLLSLTAFLLFTGTLLAQKTITGTVTDDKGNPLPNVSVVVKGSATGTVTKSDGSYSLTLPANARQLEFSFLGYETQTVNLGTASRYSLTLAPAGSKEIDEVIVTGISRTKKSEFSGASTKIDEKQIRNQPVGSLDQLFQGRAPGVLGLTSSGAPGNASTIIIRGQGSIEGGSDPLYIIDGIPVEAAVFQNLNPNDFASIDILRDASSTALYGSRGSAGVIVVTTKRGTSGKMRLNYSGQMGIKSRPDYAFRPMTTAELLKAQEDYGIGGGAMPDPTILPGWYYSTQNPRYATLTATQKAQEAATLDSISRINTNWNDAIFKQGSFSNHQISLSGGTGKTRIYSSIALYNEEGTTLRSDMSRVTLRNNIDYADDKLTMSVSTNLGYTKRNFQQSADFNTSNPFASSALAVPYHLVYKPNGTYATGVGTKYVATNQLDQTFYDENYNDQLKATLGLTLSYKITQDLTASLTSGVDFRETQNTNYGSKLVFTRLSSTSITGQAGFQYEQLSRFFTGSVRPSLTYRKLFADKHDIEVTALGEYVREYGKNFSMQGYGSDPKRPNTPAATTQGNASNQLYAVVGGGKAQTSLVSGLGIVRYTYNGKYTLSGSYRYDGSSKLPKDTRWQGFYSVGATWDATKEDFLSGLSALNVLRVKLSYGGSGNANNFPGGAYPYQATYTQGSYSGLNTIVASYPGNPEMKWETTYVTNLGIDFELFKRKLYGDINLYDKRTKDLFVNKKLSATAGFGNDGAININAGELQNKGVEWNINYEVIRNQDLVWTLFATGAYNKNEVLSLGGETSYEAGTELITVGKPLGTHYEIKWGGVDAATGAPLYYTEDGKLTSIYSDASPVQQFGTWEAPWKGGFGTTLRYKGFDLSVLFSWQQGGKKFDNLEYFVENPGGFMASGYNQSSDLNFWKKPGDITTTPGAQYSVNFSSKFIHDASFMRLRDITLSYTLPNSSLGKVVSSARVFVQGSNLFMWTKWRGRDPEAGAVNLNISEYPNPRAFTAGLDITF
ncbi:MAG: SusC/RagA family TonB-linked outer membrane protein [Chitinophagaceae bacterium]